MIRKRNFKLYTCTFVCHVFVQLGFLKSFIEFMGARTPPWPEPFCAPSLILYKKYTLFLCSKMLRKFLTFRLKIGFASKFRKHWKFWNILENTSRVRFRPLWLRKNNKKGKNSYFWDLCQKNFLSVFWLPYSS